MTRSRTWRVALAAWAPCVALNLPQGAASAAGVATAAPAPSVLEVDLLVGVPLPLPGGATLELLNIDDSRCRPAERCPEVERARRNAGAEPVLTAANGRRFQAGPLVLGEAGPAHAKLADWRVQLLQVLPAGRALPADGPDRVQRARLRLTPADRVAIGAGAAIALPRAAFTLRVLSIDDRRCPEGVHCASPGHVQVVAEVMAEVAAGSAVPQRVSFGGPAAQARRWHGHDLQLCGVHPRVHADGSTPTPAQADFFVSPADGPLLAADLNGQSCPR